MERQDSGPLGIRDGLREYFAQLVATYPPERQHKTIEWRISCFETGLAYARYIQDNHFAIQGKRVLDVACAWGGHAVAFATQGSEVVASDLSDHMFSALARFTREFGLNLSILRADCERLPFPDQTFDVVMALELVEHIPSVESFAREVGRILRPGGICVISTPARLRCLIEGEPHYGIKGITVLPLAWQRLLAARLFGCSYPFPIIRQYTTASRVIEPFASRGLTGIAVLRGRLAKLLVSKPLALRVARELLWSFLIVKRSA